MSWPLISCFTCFSACRTQITLLPCFTGHFVKLCYLYKSFEVFDWWYYKVQSVNVSTQNIVYYFITSKYNCIHTHSISPPPPPRNASQKLTSVEDDFLIQKTKNVKHEWPEATSLFWLSVLQEGQTTFLSFLLQYHFLGVLFCRKWVIYKTTNFHYEL